jgi:hypothetical protein
LIACNENPSALTNLSSVAHQRGELAARRMSHHQQPVRIAAVRGDVAVHPAQRARDVVVDVAHRRRRQQPVVERDEEETAIGERLRLVRDHPLVARLPAAAVDPEHDRQPRRVLGGVDVEHLALVAGVVLDVAGHALRVGDRRHRPGEQQDAGKALHGVHATPAKLGYTQ